MASDSTQKKIRSNITQGNTVPKKLSSNASIRPMRRPNRTIEQQEFIRLFCQYDGNYRQIAEYLGCTYQAVRQRSKRYGLSREAIADLEGACGLAATMVSEGIVDHVPPPNLIKHDYASATRVDAYSRGIKRYTILDEYEREYCKITASIEQVSLAMDKAREQNKTISGYHVDLLVKLTREARAYKVAAHKIAQEQFNNRGAKAFIEAVCNIMMKYDPELRREIYVELAQLGITSPTIE